MTPNPSNAMTPSPPIDMARSHAKAHDRARADLYARLRSLRSLGMGVVAWAMEQAVEEATETAYEAFHHYERAVTDCYEEIARHLERAVEHREIVAERDRVLLDAVLDADRRARRSGRPLPEWVERAVLVIGEPLVSIVDGRVVAEEVPF